MNTFLAHAALFAVLVAPRAYAQPAAEEPATQPADPAACRTGSSVTGTVRDATTALIPGATLQLDGMTVTSSDNGTFRFPCVAGGAHQLSISEDGFATQTLMVKTPHTAELNITLQLADVETHVDVSNTNDATTNTNTSGATQTIAGKRLQSLADDPDDLQRELQQMAAAAGGNPSNTTISVDGFEGTSKVPPKSAIAYIVVNPDQFSAQYREPPFDGARVEIYTKPGAKAFHGALFATNGSPWMNARDPFSTSNAPLGKQRYGFELTGPMLKTGSDFALTLEHRSIDDYAVVSAFTSLDSSGNPVPFSQNVAAPQRLWLGTARMDWQLGPKNTFISTYSANVNHLLNVGVGGSSLAETGYDSQTYEHMFRMSNITTATAHVMNEARLSLRWDGETDVPNSTAPQVQVAGAFAGGGANIGNQRLRELNTEIDDDAIVTTKNHAIKFGTFLNLFNEHQQLTTNFNGTYIFGGAPGVSGLQQYKLGTPTAYSDVTGTPDVHFTQVRDAIFFQDDWNLQHGLHIAYGVRYFIQNNPTVLGSVVPRLGVLWSPTKKGTWTLHAHAGMFSGRFGTDDEAEVLREDGTHRVTSTIYNPVYNNPHQGATPILSMREFSPHIGNISWAAENIGGTRTLPGGWNLSADYYIGRMWNESRSENINAPLNAVPTGPRPGPANTNILQVQSSGQGKVNAVFVGVEQHSIKRVQLFVGAVRVNLKDDSNDDPFFTPQNSHSNAGELAYRSTQPMWNVFGNATFSLPEKIEFSSNFHASGESHYNITTGFDNNGDGDFNDRPQYALAGTSSCAASPNASPCYYSTRYGNLVASGGTGVLPRDLGVMPWKVYLDSNLQRTFALNSAKADHPQTVTLNVRSANLLNHTNITSVGGVLGSPQFGQAYAADPGRRIEGGVRYTF